MVRSAVSKYTVIDSHREIQHSTIILVLTDKRDKLLD